MLDSMAWGSLIVMFAVGLALINIKVIDQRIGYLVSLGAFLIVFSVLMAALVIVGMLGPW